MRNPTQLHYALVLAGSAGFGRIGRLIQVPDRSLRLCAAVVRRMAAEWQRRRLERDTYNALRDLDASTLRDLGVDRSEIRSLAAELAGNSVLAPTRSLPALRRLR